MESRFAGRAPAGKKPASDDAAVEKIRILGGIDLERHTLMAAPDAGQEFRREPGALEKLRVAGHGVEEDKSADAITRDLGGDRKVLFDVGPIVAGDAAGGRLNA